MMVYEVSSSIAIGYLLYSIINIIKEVFKTITGLFAGIGFDFGFNLFCMKCISFWVTLICLGDLVTAALVSLTVLLLDSFLVTKL